MLSVSMCSERSGKFLRRKYKRNGAKNGVPENQYDPQRIGAGAFEQPWVSHFLKVKCLRLDSASL